MIRFLFDPDLLEGRSGTGRLYHHQIYAQMAQAHTATVLPALTTRHGFGLMPRPWEINVYFAHRTAYPSPAPEHETSVFFGHGIADKAWRNPDRVRSFTYICSSGPAWTDRYIAGGVHPDRVLEIGYPKLDPIFNGEISSSWPGRDGRVRVLWAPTHGGVIDRPYRDGDPGRNRASSWMHRDEIRRLLPASEFDLVEAPHPRARRDRRVTLAEYVGADVVIADGGSTIYEAWALGLPVVFPTWATSTATKHRDGHGTFESDIYTRRVGRHALAPTDLAAKVQAAATGGITAAETEFIEPILPTVYRGSSGARFARMLDEISSGARVPPTVEERPMPSDDRVLVRHDKFDQTIEVTARRARVLARSGWVEVTATSVPVTEPEVEPVKPTRPRTRRATPKPAPEVEVVTEPATPDPDPDPAAITEPATPES